ncbi:MAG: penicillin-binding protein 1A [Janthinobacterium lividum]
MIVVPRRRLRWLVVLGFVVLLGAAAAAGLYAWVTTGLPDASKLAEYAAPLPSTVRAGDGSVLTSFTRERRIYLTYDELPPQLVHAYISAEDKSFFEHGGLDYGGIVRAAWTNLLSFGRDRRPVGASTITQQVAKNLLLTNEVSIVRKLKEAVLARRIEAAYTKQQILEIYLNQIFLGRNSYGVEAAAQSYFGKSVADLDLAQMAYLAILPKAPSTYSPTVHLDRAIARRDYVLKQMAANRYITSAEAAQASAEPLVAIVNRSRPKIDTGDYFLEDTRRQLIAKFGEQPGDGPNSVYGGGLWIRTSIDPVLQAAAEKALRDGLVRYDKAKGWHGAAAKIALGDGWPDRLRAVKLGTGYADWYPAVVLGSDGDGFRIGFTDGSIGSMPAANAQMAQGGVPAARLLRAGDVVPVAKSGGGYALRQIPAISGGMVVEDPHTGRVLAMVGGFDARSSSFNRATQALRQPGSTFKPIVYATALDNGFTPSSIVVDAPYCVFQTRRLGQKCFKNFGGGYAGAQTLRWGLEQSRNLMTVRIAYNTGMDKVVKTAHDLGVGDYAPVLAIALGAGDTTVARLVNAYAELFDGGRKLTPTLIDLVQDRHGKVVWRADPRLCEGCNSPDYTGEAMPRPGGTPKQVIDARTAYQAVHLMEGVVTRGTAAGLRDFDRPLAGKTGTTSGPTNVWFVGGTPDLVAGLYLGYDKPRNLGGYAQGGTIAVPIWHAFGNVALKDMPKIPFVIPPGIRMVKVERKSGKRVFGGTPQDNVIKAAIIWEAFKPESEPRRTGSLDGDPVARPGRAVVRSDADFLRNAGGIY